MPAHKVEIVFITVTEPGCCNDPAHALVGFDSSQMKLKLGITGCQPTAVTELASLGGCQLLKHPPYQGRLVVPTEINYCCLGTSVCEGQIGPNP